jgi:uncharacterized protein (TIGR02996 family)
MSFTDEQPFLDAIFSRYHEDGPRLVYADYLDDAGCPERAELVRVQIALARLPEEHPRRPALANREDELRAACAPHWAEQLRGLDAQVCARRGVPDWATMDAGGFLSAGEELFRRVRVRKLRLLDAAPVMPQLAQSPLLAAVRELDLCGEQIGNGGVNLLSRSPYLKELEALDLGFNGIDDAGVWVFARSSGFPGLTSLSLNDNGQITAEGVRGLAESPFFTGLVDLDLAGNDIADAGVRVVAAGKLLPRLHTLRLKGNHVGDEGAAVLARSPLLARMLARSPRLELRENAIGPAGATSLAASPLLARCTALDLTGNYLGDRGFVALVRSPHLARLHTLRLAGNQITDQSVGELRDELPALLARLRTLDLSGNRLTRYGEGQVRAARGESGLVLDLSGNVQTSAGGEAPVTVGQVVTDMLEEVAGAAELRRRIAHPRTRPNDRTNPAG